MFPGSRGLSSVNNLVQQQPMVPAQASWGNRKIALIVYGVAALAGAATVAALVLSGGIIPLIVSVAISTLFALGMFLKACLAKPQNVLHLNLPPQKPSEPTVAEQPKISSTDTAELTALSETKPAAAPAEAEIVKHTMPEAATASSMIIAELTVLPEKEAEVLAQTETKPAEPVVLPETVVSSPDTQEEVSSVPVEPKVQTESKPEESEVPVSGVAQEVSPATTEEPTTLLKTQDEELEVEEVVQPNRLVSAASYAGNFVKAHRTAFTYAAQLGLFGWAMQASGLLPAIAVATAVANQTANAHAAFDAAFAAYDAARA
jgi:hypothetical protein